MLGQPITDLANSEFPLADRIDDEGMGGQGLKLEIKAIHSQERVGGCEANSLVAVKKSVIVRK